MHTCVYYLYLYVRERERGVCMLYLLAYVKKLKNQSHFTWPIDILREYLVKDDGFPSYSDTFPVQEKCQVIRLSCRKDRKIIPSLL